MIGGIYCEASLGPIYENGTLMSVRQGMRRLFGTKELVPKGDTLNEQIVNYWYEDIRPKMSRILSSWKPPTNRGYYNRTVDLTRSICFGIYLNGNLKRMFRFKGGHPENTKAGPSGLGSGISSKDTERLSNRGFHPDPADRARQFLEEYELLYKKDFSVVIAATMPYAVRLEYGGSIGDNTGGYALPVLKLVVNRILASVYDFKKDNKGGVFYGYVFENGGRFNA